MLSLTGSRPSLISGYRSSLGTGEHSASGLTSRRTSHITIQTVHHSYIESTYLQPELYSWKDSASSGHSSDHTTALLASRGGFASLSRRISNKPIIAAVNGQCLGGGCEVVVNCDIVVASEKATFGLPEPRVGVIAAQGAIPRLVRIAGHQVG